MTSSESGRPSGPNSTTSRSTTPAATTTLTSHGGGPDHAGPLGSVASAAGDRGLHPGGRAHGRESPTATGAARVRLGFPAMSTTEAAPAPASPETALRGRERWTNQWKELYSEVITSGLCTGCAGCVISCPHDVIGYEHEAGAYKPFHLEDELGLDNCIHGEKGCTSCTRACPRFRAWEHQADEHLFGRERERRRGGRHLQRHPADPGQRRHGPPAWARTAASCRPS